MHAFADESARGSRYIICAALVRADDVRNVRQLSRSLCAPGQRRWHFTKESDARRSHILTALGSCGLVSAWIGTGKGDDTTVRNRCVRALGPDLAAMGTTRLIFESRAGRDGHDRRALYSTLPSGVDLHYEHRAPHEDPCLWLADAIAWAYGRGGLWRERVADLIRLERDVGAA